jgi:hypothetical protein
LNSSNIRRNTLLLKGTENSLNQSVTEHCSEISREIGGLASRTALVARESRDAALVRERRQEAG